jgi:hypothetical protein
MSVFTRIVVRAETEDKDQRYYTIADLRQFVTECWNMAVPEDTKVRINGSLQVVVDQ